jgi:hypothetical protein
MVEFLDSTEYGTQYITINFRWCKPGEIISGEVCTPCNVGTYSVLWNATECLSCPDHTSCEAEVISLSKGYWRIDGNSTDIIECPNEDACLGGYEPDNDHPVNWKTGYMGLVCNEWVVDGDEKYERISENTCSQCPNPVFNIIRIVGWGLAILLFLTILIK